MSTTPSAIFNFFAKRWDQFKNPTVAMSVVLGIMIWAMAYASYREDLKQEEVKAASQTADLALMYSQKISSKIEEIDHFLKHLAKRADGDTADLQVAIEGNRVAGREAASVTIIDATGRHRTIWPRERAQGSSPETDDPNLPKLSMLHSERLFVSRPYASAKSKDRYLQFARPVSGADNSTIGAVVLSLPVAQLAGQSKGLQLGDFGGMAVLGSDDIFRAGTGRFERMVGQAYRETKVEDIVHVKLHLDNGSIAMVEKQKHGGLPQFVVAQNIPGYDLSVMVAGGGHVTMASAMSIFRQNFAFPSVASVILVFSLLFFLSNQKTTELNRRHLAALEFDKKVAEAAAESRSMFLAVMSHEIRTPINGILGALHLLRNRPLDDRGSRCITIAMDNSETLLRLVDDILLFSKGSHGTCDLASEAFAVDHLCTSVRRTFLDRAVSSGNKLDVWVCRRSAVRVIGDPVRLRQILTNLVGNANKFTHNGSIAIRASVIRETGETATIRFSVTDTGIGIPLDKQAKIFDPFETLDVSYTRRTDGTGLGLAICDKLVQSMGSRMELVSAVGEGSCFSFEVTLPLAVAKEASKPDCSADASAEHQSALRILLVEDNATNTYVATTLLADAGHDVRHAANGRQAVELALREGFDVILMDISMPEMNGLDATRIIRNTAGLNGKTPIIALTAHAVSGDEEKFLSAGMNGYLTKPIRQELLLKTLQNTSGGTPTRSGTISRVEAVAPAQTSLPVLDRDVFSKFVRDRKPDRVRRTLEIFLDEITAKIDELETVIDAANVQGLAEIAHSNIGSASLLGAARLVETSRTVERNCDTATIFDPALGKALLESMDETLQEFRASLDELHPSEPSLVDDGQASLARQEI
jgi:signal transduction histidine kinase/CheY-like chemotaxis protein/HPt (histidine-containing phosphotransfer) domain-containing protein